MAKAPERKIRCAIYTRKSTDENLNSDFTSLDAQRESGEAYIKSQQSEGWELYPERYDDPGYSGGNMDRPALQRLLRDANDGKFEMVIVYKVDRLSRSLKDFTRIIEILDSAAVSFVAVTQQFNTSTSMGRLTLNVLLSFAQFEREIISERTRDKIAASAKKGKWLGGFPVLGYDIDFDKKKLVVNEAEAAIVRFMFKTYLETKSSIKAAHAMNAKGYRSKEWTTRAGIKRGGSKFNKSSIRKYLKNPIYLGIVKHKDNLYKAEHPAIIEERTFEMVEALLAKNEVQHKSDNKDKHNFLLRGLLRCAFCGSAMTPHFSYSKKKKYFYYRCTKVNHMDRTACTVREAPARETERLIIDRLKVLSNDRGLLDRIIEKARAETTDVLPSLRQEINIQSGELRRIEGEASNLLSVLSSNGQDTKKNGFVLNRLDELEEKKRIVQTRIEELRLEIQKHENQAIDAGTIERNFATFGEVFQELTQDEKRELLRLLIKEVVYDANHSAIKMALRPLPDIGPFMVNHQNHVQNRGFDVVSSWLPELDGKRTQKAQAIQLLVAMYKYRGRQTRIVFGEPLPAKPLPPKPVPKNIVAEALKVKAFLTEDPQRTYLHASERFKVTKARISQLMKIADVLPREFVEYMGRCEDEFLIRRFSGRTLLRIVGLESPNRQQQAIAQLMERVEV